MTKEDREFAKSRIKYLLLADNCLDKHDRESLEMAIKALSQEPCDDAVSRESVDRILRDMGVNCAYDMPSFWANKGKDYKVIPTKWHKGYQQAVADFDKRIRELPSVTPSITRDIEKSNFSQEQYLLDTDSAYQIGYEKGKKEDNKPKGKWIDSKGNTVKMIDGVP